MSAPAKLVPIVFQETTRVAIIGTAGRNNDSRNAELDGDLYEKMVSEAQRVIVEEFNLYRGEVRLVSGGAAWSDHVAVELYKTGDYGGLEIHFPSEWAEGRHEDNGQWDWRVNPGRLANSQHKKFSETIGRDSQADFSLFLGDERVTYRFGKGFHSRNSEVANVDYMIAFCYDEVKGGTLDTWKKCKAEKNQKWHVALEKL